jgi:hypothetical protein
MGDREDRVESSLEEWEKRMNGRGATKKCALISWELINSVL